MLVSRRNTGPVLFLFAGIISCRAESGEGISSTKISMFHVNSLIQSRFATTNITSVVKNLESHSREIVFKAVLPNSAFISNFTMRVNDKIYIADVKEKAEAKQKYDLAKARGQTAGLAAQSIRETNTFEISTNVAAHGTAQFDLTYQEILQRVDGVYKHIININPGQVVDDLRIDVVVAEKAEISKFKIPSIEPRIGEKTNDELMALSDASDVSVTKQISPKQSVVSASYSPTAELQQKQLGESLSGQLVMLYDVNRDNSSGELEVCEMFARNFEQAEFYVVDGYFVHFFAPSGLPTGNKRVLFILDRSGSMIGTKIDQLKTAMKSILKEIREADFFNIITFSTDVTVWKPEMISATAAHIKEATDLIDSIHADGSTAIHDAMKRGLTLLDAEKTEALTSMLVFLTDGEATIGETNPDKIVAATKSWNSEQKHSIHCVAFGSDADYEMLKKISSQNRGVARKVFVDSDAAIQLKGFYTEISSPLLSEVKVKYINETVDTGTLVLNREHDYVDGSEILVLGRMRDGLDLQQRPLAEESDKVQAALIQGNIRGMGAGGRSIYTIYHPVPCWNLCQRCVWPMGARVYYPNCIWWSGECDRDWPPYWWHCPCNPMCDPPPPPPEPLPATPAPPMPGNTAGGFVERMWAYLTIKKMLEQAKYKESDATKQEDLRKQALDLSLKYHFVSELTSLVVTKDDDAIESGEVSASDIGALEKQSGSGASGSSNAGPAPASQGTFGGGADSASMATGFGGWNGARPGPVAPGGRDKDKAKEVDEHEDKTDDGNEPEEPELIRTSTFATFTTVSSAETRKTTSEPISTTTEFFNISALNVQNYSRGPNSADADTCLAECQFKTTPADNVSYDKGTLISSDVSLKSRKQCAAACAARSNCKFALWLSNSEECLFYSDEDALDCAHASDKVQKDTPVILFCITCNARK